MKDKANQKKTYPEINNRKARFDYEFLEHYTAGIVLVGSEIKSIRQGKASIVDAYCYIDKSGEAWLKNSYIARYEQADKSFDAYEERRERKLLLSKKEIRELNSDLTKKGLTIVPVSMFINSRGLCKVRLALARGKKSYDKRESLKAESQRREIEQLKKRGTYKL